MIRALIATMVILTGGTASHAAPSSVGDLDTYSTCISAYIQKRGDRIGVGAAVKLGIRRCHKWAAGLDRTKVAEVEQYITVQAYNAACRQTPESRACR